MLQSENNCLPYTVHKIKTKYMNKEQLKQHIVNNILPQKYKPFSTPSDLYESGQIVGYNQARQEDNDKLDEVIDYIYADLREKIDKLEMFDIEMSLEDGLEIVERVTMTFITAKDIKDLLTPNQE